MIHDPQRTELYKAAIGKKWTDYYLKRFASFDEQGGGFYPSWNWAAFFFSAFWVQYRKLYGLFWALLLIFVLGPIAIGQSFEILGILFYVACSIGLGAYANAFYYRRTKKIIAKAHTQQPDPQKLLSHLESRGGVGGMNPELFVIFVIVGAGMYLFHGARDDYLIRSYVQAALRPTAETRKAIEALVKKGHALGTLPVRSENISTAGSGTFGAKYVSRVAYDENGVVTITLADHEHLGAARNNTLIYVPTLHNTRLAWELSEKSTVPSKYRPRLSAWSPRKYEDKFQAIEDGTDRETVIAELGEPKTTTTKLLLRHSNGDRSDYKKPPETAYYLIWQHQGRAFVVGFDDTGRSTEKLDSLRFP